MAETESKPTQPLLIESSNAKNDKIYDILKSNKYIIICIIIVLLFLLATSFIIYMEYLNVPQTDNIKCNTKQSTLIKIYIPHIGMLYGRKTNISYEFLGIQYANITKRWTKANDLYNTSFYNNEYCGNQFGSCCMQLPSNINLNGQISEQCLFLNIYTPNDIDILVNKTNNLYDVYIWIHGGASISGCSSQSIPLLYNGTNIINRNKHKNIIIVTINYRLDILSYLYLNELNDEMYNDYPSSSNYGVLDMISALKWIYHNIIYFNGNKNAITLFGESYGARLISIIPAISDNTILGNISKMYKSIIMQSGSGFFKFFYENRTNALIKSYNISKNIGCDRNNISINLLNCLRNTNITTIMKSIYNDKLYNPHKIVIDNYLFKSYPDNVFQNSQYKNISILIGNNFPDSFPMCYLYSNLTYNESLKIMSSNLNNLEIPSKYFDAIRLNYNLTENINANIKYCDILTWMLLDASFVCPARRLLNYSYIYNQQSMNYWYQIENCNNYNMKCPKQPILSENNVCGHTYELCYVFSTISSAFHVNQSGECYYINSNEWNNDILSNNLSQFIIDIWTMNDSERSNIIPYSFNTEHRNALYYTIDPYLIANGSDNDYVVKEFIRNTECDLYDQINYELNLAAFGTETID